MIRKLKLYLELIRFEKPIGTLLLFWPCAFGTSISSEQINYILLGKFLSGAFLMRSAGCIINDIFDKDFDVKVIRTQNRPLASGKVSVKEAAVLLAIFLLISFILLLSFSINTILLAIFSLPLVIMYPLMKRITFFPQLFLGITFNYGVLVAGMEQQGYLSSEVILLYFGTIFWTLGYDTIYGFMDIKDDKKIGVKSLSIYLEDKYPKIWICLFYSIFLACFYFSISNGALLYYVMLDLFVFWRLARLNIKDPAECLSFFKINNYLAIIIMLAQFSELQKTLFF